MKLGCSDQRKMALASKVGRGEKRRFKSSLEARQLLSRQHAKFRI
jgi:hypothetical protein